MANIGACRYRYQTPNPFRCRCHEEMGSTFWHFDRDECLYDDEPTIEPKSSSAAVMAVIASTFLLAGLALGANLIGGGH